MPKTPAMPWLLVWSSCLGMFAATSTGSVRAPFLPDMAVDLSVSLPAVANLFGVTATAWGISSYLVGLTSDRIGRPVFMIGAPLLLALTMLSISAVDSYWQLVSLVIFGGCCCGALTTTAFSEVSLRTDSSQHGRALGYVMSGQSLTLLIGVPVAAWFGAITGWRGIHIILAILSSCAALALFLAIRSTNKSDTDTAASKHEVQKRATLREAITPPVGRLFLALMSERVAFGMAAFYYASYLRSVYQLPIDAVALPLVIYAVGNIIGTVLGGQLADKFPYRRVNFAITLSVAGLIAIVWFMWQPGLRVTTVIGFSFAFFNALARPSLLAALAAVPVHARSVVMGLNSSIASVGWLTAALVGGWLYATVGFTSFGWLMSGMCIVSALVVLPDSKMGKLART